MPSLKLIRKRISSVKSTQKITRAMKLVAAAKVGGIKANAEQPVEFLLGEGQPRQPGQVRDLLTGNWHAGHPRWLVFFVRGGPPCSVIVPGELA